MKRILSICVLAMVAFIMSSVSAQPSEFAGCTPGFWKQDHHLDAWGVTGYTPPDDYEAVFGVDATFTNQTLHDVLTQGGGGERALGRHAVAALLNAAHPDIYYVYSVAEVIAIVQGAYATGDFESAKNMLEAANDIGFCPLT